MDDLFLILFFISTFALIIGLIKPNIVLSWSPATKRNRKFVVMYFGLATVVFFILFGVTTPPANESAVKSEQIELENENGYGDRHHPENWRVPVTFYWF